LDGLFYEAFFRLRLHKLSPTVITFAIFVGAQCAERAKVVFLYLLDTQDSVRHVLTDVSDLPTNMCTYHIWSEYCMQYADHILIWSF